MTTDKPNGLAAWAKQAGPDHRAELVALLGSWRQTLRNLITGKRVASAATAAAIEVATIEMHRRHPELPVVWREDMCPACSTCPYALACAAQRQ